MFTIRQEMQEKFKQWFNALDSLHVLILFLKEERSHLSAIDLDTLSENTYLYHMDRILIKIRDQFYTYKYRIVSYKEDDPLLIEMPFLQVNKAMHQVYSTIVELNYLLQKKKLSALCKNKSFISKIHQLELNSSAVMSAVSNLNHFINQKETLEQLDVLEKTLMDSLNLTVESRKEILPYTYHHEQMEFELTGNPKGTYLRKKVDCIEDIDDKALVLSLISIFENLKRCYVVIRKSIINDTLADMCKQVDELIELFTSKPIKKESVFNLLNEFYISIESIRFSTNRESRCSKNLFDKSRAAKREMRQACVHHALGSEFIQTVTIKRNDGLKRKIKLG